MTSKLTNSISTGNAPNLGAGKNKHSSSWARCTAQALLALGIASSLSACYVVPIQPGMPTPVLVQPGTGAPYPGSLSAAPVQMGARLYPDNPQASSYGIISGNIVNQLDGRGVFSFVAKGETFSGEATRISNSRNGTANAAGSMGSYMNCTYTMNNPQQGSGKCVLNNGAAFNMHIGS